MIGLTELSVRLVEASGCVCVCLFWLGFSVARDAWQNKHGRDTAARREDGAHAVVRFRRCW